ncbi:MAG: serine/threonine-protein kinase [Leptolyngbya sp.]|nr:serine/threonine-protein kinase [Leptolyngbya sp.]
MAITRPIRRSHYRLLGLVGHGQFGQVYCAIHRKSGEMVALKYLHRDRFPTHKFLRELRFLLSLEHPNIVTCQALEHSANGRYLVMDYCEGGTLRSILESDTVLSWEEMLGLVMDILAGLEHAHQQGIVHCDIKPENILLTLTPGGWVARISDFGIARLSQEVSEAAMGHSGSPAYMAPERFYNQHPLTSDLYAVGVILYEMLLGKRPFSGTPMELMVAHMNEVPTIPEELPAAIRAAVAKSLQKLAPKRFQSAQAMRQDLGQIYQDCRTEEFTAISLGEKTLPNPVAATDLPSIAIPHPIHVMGWAALPQPEDAASINLSPSSGPSLLITAAEDQVWFYHWPEQGMPATPVSTQGFTLPGPVQSFVPLPQGGILATSTSLHLLSIPHGLGRIAQETSPIQMAVAPHGRWFATVQQPQPAIADLLIRHLRNQPQAPVKISAACRVSVPIASGHIVALLALDLHHLGLVVRQHQTTLVHLITRRGQYLGPLTLPVPLRSLVPTQRPYRYLALEVDQPQSLLVIDLKPLRMVRYRADIQPRWIFETAVGYGLLSEDGHLSLMNEEGQIINRVTQLPCPTAMVQRSPSQFLWSVPDGDASRLYSLDLAQLGLDLVF